MDARVALPSGLLLLKEDEEEGDWKEANAARERIGVVDGSIGVLGLFTEGSGQLEFSTLSFRVVG